MKKAPRIVMKVENGKITYLELPTEKPTFQLTAEPKLDNKSDVR